MTKLQVLENPETGDIIFLNKIIKIKQFDADTSGYYKYSILTTDQYYTDFYARVPHWHMLIQEYKA